MAEPVTDPVEEPPVEVAGLVIPADLAPRIIKAFRELYATITEGKDDDAAVRAVLMWFIGSVLETHATRKVDEEFELVVEQARVQASAKGEQMRQQIRIATKRIKEKPVPPGLVE